MEHMQVPFDVKQVDESDGFLHVYGYGNTYDVDLGNDETMPGAFEDTIRELESNAMRIADTKFKSLVPALWQHNQLEPIGSHVELREEPGKGLFTHSIYPLDDTFVSGRLGPQLRVRSVKALSIGYSPKQVSFREDDNGDMVRRLEKVGLREISPVTFPMNTQAVITGMKDAKDFKGLPLADRQHPWDAEAALTRVREFTDSTDSPGDAYKGAFLHFDQKQTQNFESYHLLVADVVDGELKAIPKAVFAAAAGLQGGVDVPKDAIDGIKHCIEQYYKNMDRESPFKSDRGFIVHKDMLDTLTERDIDRLLRKGVCFSRATAKSLIACLNINLLRDAKGSGVSRDAEKTKLDEISAQLQMMQIQNKMGEILR